MKTTLLAVLLATCAGTSLTSAATLSPGAIGDAPVNAATAGRVNIALASAGGVAFSSSDLGPNYSAPDVNDGVIDQSGFSWIPATANVNEFVGVRFAGANSVGAVVWHGQTGYNGRSGGTYSLQYSRDASPGAGSTWNEIGTYVYAEAGCATPMPRTYFSFTPVEGVTGMRLLFTAIGCGVQPAIQELEAFAPAVLSPSATGVAAVAGAIAGRPNVALASAGGVAFSSSDLGPDYSSPDVNNGITDDTGFSWIPTDSSAGQFVGVGLATPSHVDSVVWHGQTAYNGRSGGTYSLEYTTDSTPGSGSSWTSIGSYTYTEGGCAAPMPRSLFSFSVISNVTGIRLMILNSACGIQLAIQELEAYGPLVSPPTIETQPIGGSFAEGSIITLSVGATGGTGYQWKKDGVNISGATSSSYTIGNASTNDSGSYTVLVSNSAGNIPSDAAEITVTPAPVFTTYLEAVLSDNPIHYYPLDETSGATAADLGSLATSGGTYAGGIALGQGSVSSRLGTAARFDGAPGTLVDLGLFHPGNSVSVEAWVNLDPSANNNSYHAIVARWDGSYELDFAPGDLANLVVRRDGGGIGVAAGASSTARGGWHHLVGVFDAGVVTVYVDGVKGSEANIGGVLQDAGPAPDRVMIGATRSGSVSSFNFKGLIDEVAIYDTALSAAQVRAHFRAAVPPVPPELTIRPAVLITWPAFPPNFVLQTASKVEGPYTNYSGEPPALQSGTFKLTVPLDGGQQFFRLFGQ